jgi:hypothetical protein
MYLKISEAFDLYENYPMLKCMLIKSKEGVSTA